MESQTADQRLKEIDLIAEEEARRALRSLQGALHEHLRDTGKLEDDDYLSGLLSLVGNHLEAAARKPVSYGLSRMQVTFND